MHLFIQALVIYGAILCVGVVLIARFIWAAEVYPCENCGSNPATRETVTGRQLCEGCYQACEKDFQPATSSSENLEERPNEEPIPNSVPPSAPSGNSPKNSPDREIGEPRFHQTLK